MVVQAGGRIVESTGLLQFQFPPGNGVQVQEQVRQHGCGDPPTAEGALNKKLLIFHGLRSQGEEEGRAKSGHIPSWRGESVLKLPSPPLIRRAQQTCL